MVELIMQVVIFAVVSVILNLAFIRAIEKTDTHNPVMGFFMRMLLYWVAALAAFVFTD